MDNLLYETKPAVNLGFVYNSNQELNRNLKCFKKFRVAYL